MAEEKKADAKKIERIYTVPLGKAYDYLHTKRARRAIKLLREFMCRHFRVEEKAVRISAAVNDAIWRDGIQKPPRRIKVRAVLEEGKVKVWMIGEEEEIKKKEEEKKAKEEKMKKERQESAKKDEKKEKEKEKEKGEKEGKEGNAKSKPVGDSVENAANQGSQPDSKQQAGLKK